MAITHKDVQDQLKRIGVEIRLWGKAEMRELATILMPHEQIVQCINGRYDGGFAMICATNERLFIIDKKPLFLTIEDIRYDMITEVDFNRRLMDSNVVISSPGKKVFFMTIRHHRLRQLATYVQYRIIELRQMMSSAQASAMFAQALQPATAGANNSPLMAATAVPNTVFHQNEPPYGRVASPFGRNPYTKLPLMVRKRWTLFSR